MWVPRYFWTHSEFLMYFNSRQIEFTKRLRFSCFSKIIASAMVDSDFPRGGKVFLVLLFSLS